MKRRCAQCAYFALEHYRIVDVSTRQNRENQKSSEHHNCQIIETFNKICCGKYNSVTNIGGESYWAGRAAPIFLPLWAANVSGPPTFGHLIRPKKIRHLCSEFHWNSPGKSLSLYPLLIVTENQ